MSTIHDAQKKSERPRKLDKVPTLGTMRPPEEKRSAGIWVGLVSVVVCIAVGVIAWLYLGRSGESSVVVERSVTTQAPPAVISGGSTPDQPVSEPAPEVSRAPSAPVEVVDFRSLPRSVVDQLPDLTVNVISYSGDSQRNFVMMENGIYRVGDIVADGLVVDKIEPNAAVLDYMGQKIRIRP
jgi:hypothetical protein